MTEFKYSRSVLWFKSTTILQFKLVEPITRLDCSSLTNRNTGISGPDTTLKSAIAAPRRNCGRRYPILLCHLLTQNWQNQKFRCSPETFRLSFYGIQGVPKINLSFWHTSPPRIQGENFGFNYRFPKPGLQLSSIFFWDTLDTIKA